MKKIILNETQKRAAILEREKAIYENFTKTFNKIKRIDENELDGNMQNLEKMRGLLESNSSQDAFKASSLLESSLFSIP